MPIKIIREDITKLKCDAIVNAANSTLLGGGGVDGAIHKAAGKELLEECKTLGGCDVGEAKITKGYKLPAKYVIHTVGPIWWGGEEGEEKDLISCYKASLDLALKYNLSSIAFPLISTGAYGYPKDKAFKIALDVCTEYSLKNDLLIYIVIFDKASFNVGSKLFSNIKEYVDDNYCEENYMGRSQILYGAPIPLAHSDNSSIEDILNEEIEKELDESFSQMLLRKIDEKGMKDSQCYKKANVDRKLFSKIRSNINYKPSKQTAVAFAIALELDLKTTNLLLSKAGYTLSHSYKFDIIIEYFIKNKNYDILLINQALFYFDQPILG